MPRPASRIGWSRVLVTAGCIVVWRAMAQITVAPSWSPGLLMFVFPGFPHSNIAELGVSPYIYAVVAFTVVRAISPTVRRLSHSDTGRRRLERSIRALAVAFAGVQGYAIGRFYGMPDRVEVTAALAASTMVLVLLGDVLDEHGLGFGYGVYLIYALGFVPRQAALVHDFLTVASLHQDSASYRPIAVWALAVIILFTTSAAVLASWRPVRLRQHRRVAELHLPLMLSGVLRPALLAGFVMTLPVTVAGIFNVTHPDLAGWLFQNWTPTGPNPWGDAGYTILHAAVVILMTCLVSAVELDRESIAMWLRNARIAVADVAEKDAARLLRASALKLATAGGVALALIIVVGPAIADALTRGTFQNAPPVSGTLVALLTALVLALASRLRNARRDVLLFAPAAP